MCVTAEYWAALGSTSSTARWSTSNPVGSVRRLCSVRTSSIATTSSASDSANCVVTRPRRINARRRPLDALRPPSASDRPRRRLSVATIGARPQAAVASAPIAAANVSTRQSSDTSSIDRVAPLREQRHGESRRHCRDEQGRHRGSNAEDRGFGQQQPDESSPARAERRAQRHLAFPLAGSREKQTGHVRAGDEQHDARRREQQPQRRGRHFGQHRITLTTRQHRKPAGSRTIRRLRQAGLQPVQVVGGLREGDVVADAAKQCEPAGRRPLQQIAAF